MSPQVAILLVLGLALVASNLLYQFRIYCYKRQLQALAAAKDMAAVKRILDGQY